MLRKAFRRHRTYRWRRIKPPGCGPQTPKNLFYSLSRLEAALYCYMQNILFRRFIALIFTQKLLDSFGHIVRVFRRARVSV